MVSAEEFLTNANRIKWQAFIGALSGSVLMAWWTGIITVTQTIGTGIAQFFSGLATAYRQGWGEYLTLIDRLFTEVWTLETTFGVFTLPVSVVIALTAAAIIAYGVQWYVK